MRPEVPPPKIALKYRPKSVALTDLYKIGILMHMRTTLNIDNEIIKEASYLTGIHEKTLLIKMGLKALIAIESAKKLALLGGTEKKLKIEPRRRLSA